MLKFISRHWRGEANFWLGLIVYSIILTIAVITIVSQWIGVHALQDTPWSRITQASIGFFLIGAVGVWQLVGMWRASSKSKSPQRWFLTRWIARLVALGAAVLAFVLVAKAPVVMSTLYAAATDNDQFGQQGYSVSADGDQLIINGSFAWGLLNEVSKTLAENGHIQTVVLNSPGGHVGVGTRLGDIIKARNLDTFTNELCASACTHAFVSGNNRYLRNGAKLGFHNVNGDSQNAIDMGKKAMVKHFRDDGITEDFIDRIFETPAEDVWYPTNKELRAAKVITEVVE